jgi:4-oxalocrotonate tautomerase
MPEEMIAGRGPYPVLGRGGIMPLVIVKMLEGRTTEQKRRLAREITDVVTRVTGAPEDQVDVVIEDHPRENWAKAGTLFCDR